MTPHQPQFFQAEKEPDIPLADRERPLASRMRPRSLSEIVGQDHLVGEDSLLPRLLAGGHLRSIILYGPPGSGKTSLAEAIAGELKGRFVRVNAVLSSVSDLRGVLLEARHFPERRTVVFIDEIHRFNKAQQDLLLPDVENGAIRLIGATTHNPGHYVIPPLLSRSHLLRLNPLDLGAIEGVLERAVADDQRGMGAWGSTFESGVIQGIARNCNGDLRQALNLLETLMLSVGMKGAITQKHLESFFRERQVRYDSGEDEHYDTISAFIKSVRGSDPDAAVYWLAKMILGGEDPRFIARRLVILASEDIGLADSRGINVALAAAQAVELIGMPEGEYPLVHATLFLALCPKSNSANLALHAAKKAWKTQEAQSVPLHLKDSHLSVNIDLGNGKDYRYSHDYPDGISGQNFMEVPQQFYTPKAVGAETALAERLARWKTLKAMIQQGM
jgi:putative ATPase